MISYELVKKLKDANYWLHKCMMSICTHNGVKIGDSYFHLPTLSELIDSVKKNDKWFNLHYYPLGDDWTAILGEGDAHEYVDNEAQGKTADDAVANLWLALNSNIKKEFAVNVMPEKHEIIQVEYPDEIAYCYCTKHNRHWDEDDYFEKDGGKACEECIIDKSLDKRVIRFKNENIH
jgi:hypothetical protein